jgi:uncharacterized membrane protein
MQPNLATDGSAIRLSKARIYSIDVLRGLAMVIMALDHVRDYFHITANTDDPLNLVTTTPWLFFARWITHYCAPTFVFLSGTSIFLQSMRKSKAELSGFLIKRGLWLILIEFAVISFGWTFNPHYPFFIMQVIWAIGISMVMLGLLIRLPYKLLFAIGFIIVFGHNLLDIPESRPGFEPGFLWDLLHSGLFRPYFFSQDHAFLIVYPFLPWLGLMIIGYCAGIFYSTQFTKNERKKILIVLGTGLIVLFIILRGINVYGDPDPWSVQPKAFYTFLSFIKLHKYPPSLLYMCMTIGPALILLALLEKVENSFTRMLGVFGRVAFFYYIIHIYLIHFLSAISYLAHGHSFEEGTNFHPNSPPFYFVMPGEGYPLVIVLVIWLLVLVILYPICKWYDQYKLKHKEKWWLSYL